MRLASFSRQSAAISMVAIALSGCANQSARVGESGSIRTFVIRIDSNRTGWGEPWLRANRQALRQVEARWRTYDGISARWQSELRPVDGLSHLISGTTITILPPVIENDLITFGPARDIAFNLSTSYTGGEYEGVQIKKNQLCYVDHNMRQSKCIYAFANANGAMFFIDEDHKWVAVSGIAEGDPYGLVEQGEKRRRQLAQQAAARTSAQNYAALMGGIWALAMGAAAFERAANDGRPPVASQNSPINSSGRTPLENTMNMLDLTERIPVRTQFGYR